MGWRELRGWLRACRREIAAEREEQSSDPYSWEQDEAHGNWAELHRIRDERLGR